MRDGLIGLVSGMVLVSMATVACSSGGGSGRHRWEHRSGGSTGSAGTMGTAGTSGGGAGGGGGSGSSVTTISGTKALNALTPTEVTQLCDDTLRLFRTAIPKATTCRWRDWLTARRAAPPPTRSCRRAARTRKPRACGSANPWADNLGCNDLPATCAATVAQYSACISDEVAAFIQLVERLPDVLGAGALERVEKSSNAIAGAPPASCALADEHVPGAVAAGTAEHVKGSRQVRSPDPEAGRAGESPLTRTCGERRTDAVCLAPRSGERVRVRGARYGGCSTAASPERAHPPLRRSGQRVVSIGS